MKIRETIVLLLVLSLAFVPVVSQSHVASQSQSRYTESIEVYDADSNAYSVATFGGINATGTLATAEATSGLSAFQLTALSTQSFESDYEIFGPSGYGVLNVPSLPSEGVFLIVNASSESATTPLVTYFDGALGTNLTLISSGSGTYTYSGPVDFDGTAAPVLYKLVPTKDGGFTSVFSESTLIGLPFPSITLVGSATSNGFANTISLGAASNTVIDTNGVLDFLKVTGGTNATVTASTNSTSSRFVVHALDGIISSTDTNATVTSDLTNFSSSYSLPVAAGDVLNPNVTISSSTPTLNAYRTVALTGAPGSEVLSVTLWLTNTAESSTIQNMTIDHVSVDDNWWKSDNSTLVPFNAEQNFSTSVEHILPTANTTLVYKLNVTSTAQSEVVIPPTTVTYSYLLGNSTVQKTTTTNGVDLQLNGNVEPAMNVVVQPVSPYFTGAALGSNASLAITITNSGSAPATDLKIAGRTIADAPADTTLPTVDVPLNLTSSLLARNVTEDYTLSWSNAAGQTESIPANDVSLVFAHSAMDIPYIEVGTTESVTAQTLTSRLLNVTYTLDNIGSANTGAFAATQTLPAGVTCSVVSTDNGTVTCGSGTASITFKSIQSLATETVTVQLNFSQNDYIVPPLTTSSAYKTITLGSAGEGFAIAAGLVTTKSFSPTVVFPGMTSVVTITILNDGSQTLYNVTASSSSDAFDTISGSTTAQKTFDTVTAHESVNFTYDVTISKALSGNLSAEPTSVSFVMGGTTQSLSLGESNLIVYKPLALSAVSSTASPETGKDFSVTFTVTNDAPTALSDVDFNWTLPSGVSLVSGAQSSGHLVTESLPSIAADSNENFTITLSANIGLTFDTSGSHLSYQYNGATLSGTVYSTAITVREDVTTNFAVPIVLAIVIALAALFYVRRLATPAAKT